MKNNLTVLFVSKFSSTYINYTTLDPYLTTFSTSSTPPPRSPLRCAYVGHSLCLRYDRVLLASISCPEFFSKLLFIGASPRFLNDKDYHERFEKRET
ncbi:hypothetical protein LINGRAPRIM_LOCUS3023 [Linum grandiflorum]